MAATVRAALYLRVSTGRQADSDLSIPDQRRQAKAYCASRGWEIVAEYVEPGASATDDRRPEFQRMIDAATVKPPAFDVILVHSFSMRTEQGGYRRDHLRALAQRIEVDAKEVRIMGSKSVLLRTLVAASGAKSAGFGVPSFVPKWRARRDSNS